MTHRIIIVGGGAGGLEDFVGYLWLIIFPEAFINGMVISALVVFCPEWLETFNRTRYLSAPWKDDDSQT